jgi:ectoine hydroxylase-related dioxygenase (phytanoyl-CoA dioxygenase family)
VAQHHCVEPSGAPPPTSVGPELSPDLDHLVAVIIEQLGREGTGPDAGHIGLGDPDHTIDVFRSDSCTGTRSPGSRVARRHERVRTVIEIEERGLRPLEQHVLPGIERVMNEIHRIGDVGPEDRQALGQHLVRQLIGIDGQPVEHSGQHLVAVPQHRVKLGSKDVLVEHVLDSDAQPHRLVGVRRADTTLGRSQLGLAQMALVQRIELLVIGQDQVGIARDLDLVDADAPTPKHVHFPQQHERIDHDAVADDRSDVFVEHPTGNQLKGELLVADHQRMTSVVASLIADDHGHLFGQEIGELPLAFVAPLGSDHNRCRHVGQPYRAGNAALHSLGEAALGHDVPMETADIRRHLEAIDDQGYTIVSIEPDLTRRLVETVARLEDELAVRPMMNRAEGYNTKRIYNLLAKDRVFWEMPVHEQVLPVVTGLLDKWAILSGTTAMNIGPGEDLQGMHTDEGNISLPRPRQPLMAVTIWALTDFTAENGATRLVPGSHRADREPRPDEDGDAIAAEMPAGSVLIMHGGTWHCGGPNTTTDQWRMGANIQYCVGWMRTQQNHYLSIPDDEVRAMPKRLQQLAGYGLHKGAMGHVDGQSPGAIIGATETARRAYEYSEERSIQGTPTVNGKA